MPEALLSGPVSGFFLGRPSATINRQGPHQGPLAFGSDRVWESNPRDAGRERGFGEHGSPPRARAGHAGPAPGDSRRLNPSSIRARIVSGPFSLCVSPEKRADVLRVAADRSTRNRPLFASAPSLFSVWSAGRRSGRLCKFNRLRARVRCQPTVPVAISD